VPSTVALPSTPNEFVVMLLATIWLFEFTIVAPDKGAARDARCALYGQALLGTEEARRKHVPARRLASEAREHAGQYRGITR
jgi:hypothetical protein